MFYTDYSFTKINLFLDVLGIRQQDGFHNIRSLFVPIDWADKITTKVLPDNNNNIVFDTDDIFLKKLDFGHLTIGKAIKLLEPYKNNALGVQIFLQKRVPYNAGLGIASSNAVVILKRLNQIWDCRFSTEQLQVMATSIGADCTFFWEDKICLITGKGEHIEPLGYKPFRYPLWILKPKSIAMSTVDGYKKLKEKQYYNQYSLNSALLEKIRESQIEFEDLKDLAKNIFFDIMKTESEYLREIENFLKTSGGIVQMSGSGASLFVIHKNKEGCQNFFRENFRILQKNFDFWVTIL